MEKFLEILKKYRDLIYISIIIIFGIIFSGQCSRIDNLNHEIDRQENNKIALTEQIVNYKDELGRVNAEKHAYQLTQEELRDSIDFLKKKNSEYVYYINTNMNIKDTVILETVIIKEVDAQVEGGTIKLEKSDVFGKSSSSLFVNIPYNVNENKLFTGDATFALDQNIFVEGWLERNIKTKETYIHLRSDYPGLVFNSGIGIVAEPSKKYEKDMRKSNGIGLAIGPNFSLSYDFISQKFVPSVGLGITIGYTYTPKLFQW